MVKKEEEEVFPMDVEEQLQQSLDEIHNPDHYQGDGLSVINVIQKFNLGFELGNAFKYIARCEKKGNKKKDLLKAIRNIEFEIEKMHKSDSL